MTATAFVLILAAAALHAAWNSLVKMSGDALVTAALIMGVSGLVGLPGLFLLPLPAPASWPVLGFSLIVHGAYIFFLLQAYRHGNFGQVYPIARGTAPLILATFAFVAVGERLSPTSTAAVVAISVGIVSLALSGGAVLGRDLRPVLFALATAVFIASYTLLDGIGARAAGSPHSYAVWLFVLHGVSIVLLAWLFRRGVFIALARKQWRRGLAAGIMGIAAYWIVIWALSIGTMAQVAALRETSVVFAAVIGSLVLKESFGRFRIAAAALVAAGIVLLQV